MKKISPPSMKVSLGFLLTTQHSARAKRTATALSAAMPAGFYRTQHFQVS
ncbi:MAG: hypothetical protein RMY34_20495 [Aulosira sp. DedQUE10]|nr:hypothetical protein [Aulosira sp. DedQUE10]